MNYEQALAFIHSRPRFPKKPSLSTMQRLMEKLNNPQDNLKFVHIAGTNGKGSCASMLASVLKHSGYTVGLNISPYVLTFCERISVNGDMILPETLADLTEKVKTACEEMEQQDEGTPNEFEIVTALAFLYFDLSKCDIVCLEVGIGGKYDATNIIKNPIVSCIMKIGLDHTAQLGGTKELIAAEKAGIIKQNSCVVSYPKQSQVVADIIENTAKAQNSEYILPSLEDLKCYTGDVFHNLIDYGGYQIVLPFIGEHQALNAMVVMETAFILGEKGFAISDDAIIEGIEQTKFPARIEILSQSPRVILDGCHNQDSFEAFAETLAMAKLPKMTAIVGMLQEKDPEKLLQQLKPYFKTVYTVPIDNPRAISPTELADIAENIFDEVIAVKSIKTAIQRAKKEMINTDTLCVFGSLYLCSEAREIIMDSFK